MAELFGKYTCTYCQENINGLRVQCCVCEDFDICLQCFASGAEIGPHKNDHSYRFKDSCGVILFGGRGNWTCKEEVQLLDAMELYGFGNWELISKHIGTKTPEEVKEEYITRYLEGSIGRHTWGKVINTRTVHCELETDKGPLAPDVTSRLPPLDITPEECEQLGYMPHRDDFEREYDTDAEQLVSSLSVSPNQDSEVELALKLAQVDKYTRRLRERARRKRVVRDYQLVAKFFATQRKDSTRRVLSKEQKEFRDRMRVFSQFHTSAEHERLIENIERERELRMRIGELLRYRSLGLTTQQEVLHYEQHVAFQQQQQQQRPNKTGSSGFGQLHQESQIKSGENGNVSNFIDQRCTFPENVGNNSNWDDSTIVPSLIKLPGSSMLSVNEFQLCTSLNLLPLQYITLKSLIIQEHLLSDNGKILLESNSKSTEMRLKDAVTEYLAVSGWLPGVSVV
ncbi:transcriptional Adaptor 2b [Carabus blaptoides fortunei]